MILCDTHRRSELTNLLAPAAIRIVNHPTGQGLPGSYWGAPEAGIRALAPPSSGILAAAPVATVELHVNAETPLHSALHEAAHVVCMDSERRNHLDTDAYGSDLEECAVCYLQILWACRFAGVDLLRACRDMDDWGYSFRLGSALRWFLDDAADARQWLIDQRVIVQERPLRWRPRI